jgi:hypothetical protein
MASSMRATSAGNSSTWSARSDSASWVRVHASIRGTIVLLFESTHAMASCEALMPFSVAQRLQRLNQALIALAVFTGDARQVRALSGGRRSIGAPHSPVCSQSAGPAFATFRRYART